MSTPIHVYFAHTSTKTLELRQKLTEKQLPYVVRYLQKENLSYDDFIHLLSLTENGTMDILSTRSTPYRKLTEQGIDFDELSLSQLYGFIEQYPTLLTTPMCVWGDRLYIGKDDIDQMMIDRRQRDETMSRLLEKARKAEHLALEAELLANREARKNVLDE